MQRLLVAALLVSAAALAGCGANPDRNATHSIPDDYRTRHPIVLTEAEHTMDIPVATGDRSLPRAVRDNIRGFAAEHASKSRGAIQIMLPRGSANAGSADRARKEIRATLTAAGVPRDRIIETSYDAGGYGDIAPIRLAFFAIAAKTGPCGEWPEDLVENTMENRNYHNFGCATQSNLAAQIANPMDLVQPRGMSPIDAERRGVVIETYRDEGQPLL
nr:CpaD family pilus assembly protein [Shinella pollutisoli]